MDQKYIDNAHKIWNDRHKDYERSGIVYDDWLERFDDIITASERPIMDLGCGSGNDTLYLIEKGKAVIACDQSENAIKNINKNFPEVKETACFDMLKGLPFKDGSFDIIIADLCLHYFFDKDTAFVVSEIQRVLADGGHLIFRVNSINDVNYGAGQGIELEHHVYEMDDKTIKRFFDENDIRRIFGDFEIEYLKEEVMFRYVQEKRLFRVCVRK